MKTSIAALALSTSSVMLVASVSLVATLLTSIAVALSALNVPEFWQQAINGFLLLLAITADRLVALHRERRSLEEVAL